MSVQFHDPRANPVTPPQRYGLQAQLDGPVVIGLLANGFPDSVSFLDQVERALGARLPEAHFRRYDKGNASRLAPPEMLDAIAGDCAVAVAAYGH